MKKGSPLFFLLLTPVVVLMLFLANQDVLASPQKPVKRILILYSNDRQLPAQELTEKGIRSATQSNQEFEIELFHEYLDFARFEQTGYKETLVRFLGDKYGAQLPDLIISVLPQALPFLLNYCQHIFPAIPIVACTIYETTAKALEQTENRQRVTGVIFKGDIGDIVPVVRALRPGLRRIALVGGASEVDRNYQAMVLQALKPYEPGVEVLNMTVRTIPDIVEQVSNLPPDHVLFYTSINRDEQGKPHVPRQALATISKAANVPTFGVLDSYLGYGIVGGRLLSFEAQGKKAADLAMRIFSGEAPQDIPFAEYDTTSYMFDWHELDRWGISEKSLPAGSTVKFKTPTVWDEHWGFIVTILVVLCLESALIVTLIKSLRTSRRMREDLNASEQRYRTVADYTFNWEYWTAPNGSLHYISPACETLTGYTPQQFLDNPALLHELIVPADRAVWEENELTHKEIQFRIRRADDEIRWIAHSCQAVTSAAGEPLGIRACNRDVTVRKRAEERLMESERDLHKLTSRLIWGQEEERRRLARELHDDLTQRMAILAIQIGRMEHEAQEGRQIAPEEFRNLQNQSILISTDIHALSRQLHPAILDDLGLVKAVEAECCRFSDREGIKVQFTAEKVIEPLPKMVALSLYRIIQEGFTNIAKYSCARHVEVSLHGSPSDLCLSVRDDGIGFDMTHIRKKAGLGFSSMRERVRIIEGSLRISAEPEKGTVIEVKVPLNNKTLE
jgi:PAS domain S-box-containing protein